MIDEGDQLSSKSLKLSEVKKIPGFDNQTDEN